MLSAKSNKSINSTKGLISNSKIFEVPNGSTPVFEEDTRLISEDIFPKFRGLLILGRILGLIPISGVFKLSYRDLSYRFRSVAGITSLLCVGFLCLNSALAIWNAVRGQKRNPLEIARSIQNPLFASWGAFIYIYFLARGHLFVRIFKLWAKSEVFYSQTDTSLHFTIVAVSVTLFTSCVLENAVLHMEFFEAFDDINGHIARWGRETGNHSVIQMYYWRSHSYWDKVLGYHPIFVVIAFFVHKWVLYGWNYIDVLMALMCRALYFKFKALCQKAEESLFPEPEPLELLDKYIPSERDRQAWAQLANDHTVLCELLEAVNQFFSPVLFVSYSINIYFVCMQLLGSLNPEIVSHSLVHSIYAPWSFIHIIIRIFILSIFAARVNVYAHYVRDIVQRCPMELYDGPIAKLDKRVNVGPKLGLNGLGCFVVSKPLMLSILNVVFTIEIVLLQGLQTTSTTPTKCP